MATTGFWPVKGSLRDVVRYADNPDKTTNPKYLDDDLAAALKYVANDDKTDKELFVTGINCPSVRAYEQMMVTKRRYGKMGGNVAYHGYQSFKTGEVTPEEAHKIGLETARRMWGKDYEIVVTTHLNTDNLHNHIVINSVSFKTGLKFENHIKDHIHLREISDAVCKEYEKSVIENAKFYSKNKKLYWVHKNGGLTHRDMLKRDVDEAILQSANLDEFCRILKHKGYTFNRDIYTEHPSVIANGWERPVRIDSLGEDYTKTRLAERAKANSFFVSSFGSSPRVAAARPKTKPLSNLERELRRIRKMDVFEAIFYLILELLKPSTPKPNYRPPLSPFMREQISKFNQYQKQFRLLHENKIETVPELELFIANTQNQIKELEDERSKTDNKRRRAKTDEDKELYKSECREITKKITPLRENLKTAKAALESVPIIQKAIESERIEENKVKVKELER